MEKTNLLLIKPNISIKDGWRQLNENNYKILFVIDEQEKLIGSVTDGDIRRWLLGDHSLQESISQVMNTKPLTVFETTEDEIIRQLMLKHRIECIPVVDLQGRAKRFVFWNNLIEQKNTEIYEKIDVPVVIMAGGRGVRLDPFTKILPKPLIPIGDKPILEIIVEKFRRYDVKKFYFSVNYRASMIKAYFDEVQRDYELHYIEEVIPSGTAGSLHLLQGKIKTTFMISNCDIVIDANYADILLFHRKNQCKITLVGSMKHFPIPYGVVEIENGGMLKGIREKPEFDFLVNTGLYILEPELLEIIPKNQVYHITHLIEHLQKEKQKIGVYPISSSSWVDVGELKEYKETLMKFE